MITLADIEQLAVAKWGDKARLVKTPECNNFPRWIKETNEVWYPFMIGYEETSHGGELVEWCDSTKTYLATRRERAGWAKEKWFVVMGAGCSWLEAADEAGLLPSGTSYVLGEESEAERVFEQAEQAEVVSLQPEVVPRLQVRKDDRDRSAYYKKRGETHVEIWVPGLTSSYGRMYQRLRFALPDPMSHYGLDAGRRFKVPRGSSLVLLHDQLRKDARKLVLEDRALGNERHPSQRAGNNPVVARMISEKDESHAKFLMDRGDPDPRVKHIPRPLTSESEARIVEAVAEKKKTDKAFYDQRDREVFATIASSRVFYLDQIVKGFLTRYSNKDPWVEASWDDAWIVKRNRLLKMVGNGWVEITDRKCDGVTRRQVTITKKGLKVMKKLGPGKRHL